MDHRAIEVDEMQDEAIDMAGHSGSEVGSMGDTDFATMMNRHRRPLWMPNGPGSTSHPVKTIGTSPSHDDPSPQEAPPSVGSNGYAFARVSRGLEERRASGFRTRRRSPGSSIFRLPATLGGINQKAEEPEIVSIGPYHRGKPHLLDFEEQKWSFLEQFLDRRPGYLGRYIEAMTLLEQQTRECYSEPVLMSSGDFVEMMLFDGCFVIELLLHFGKKEAGQAGEDDPIFSQPWIIPVLIRDLLKLENQLPFFVLESLFNGVQIDLRGKYGVPTNNYLSVLALDVFNLMFPRPLEMAVRFPDLRGNHLLHLFHLSLVPSSQTDHGCLEEHYRPSDQSIQSAIHLKPSGIKFKSSKTCSFLDISFLNKVLEIPSITVNDLTSTLLINCLALEQGQESGPKYLTDYVSFMSCLINEPKDVALLCSDGIITRFSQDDIYVANLFNKLGKSLVFNVYNCYLSKRFRDIETFYCSNWATMMRTYFCSPWSFISVFSAFLIILLSAVQTVFAVISYKR